MTQPPRILASVLFHRKHLDWNRAHYFGCVTNTVYRIVQCDLFIHASWCSSVLSNKLWIDWNLGEHKPRAPSRGESVSSLNEKSIYILKRSIKFHPYHKHTQFNKIKIMFAVYSNRRWFGGNKINRISSFWWSKSRAQMFKI